MYCIAVNIIVITQPDNTTVCEGGTAVFTCVMDILNTGISIKDIRWWRIRTDQNAAAAMLTQHFDRYNITNSINGHKLTGVLVITNVKLLDMGPYWLGLIDEKQLICSMAFLSIISQKGTCVYMHIFDCLCKNQPSLH